MMISRAQIGKIVQIYKAQDTKNVQKPVGPSETIASDNLNLPFDNADLLQIREIIDKLPDVREDKVRHCAAEVKEGAYEVDPKEVAEKLLGRLFADKIR